MTRIIIIAILSFFLSGCALFELFWEDEDDETAQALAWDGMEDYESGDVPLPEEHAVPIPGEAASGKKAPAKKARAKKARAKKV